MIKKENQAGSKIDKSNEKAPYSSPQLVTYGDIQKLTLTVGTAGAIDTPATIINNKTR